MTSVGTEEGFEPSAKFMFCSPHCYSIFIQHLPFRPKDIFLHLGLLLNTQSTITTTTTSTFLAARKYIQQVEMHLMWCNSILTSGGGLKFSQGKNRCRRIFSVLPIYRTMNTEITFSDDTVNMKAIFWLPMLVKSLTWIGCDLLLLLVKFKDRSKSIFIDDRTFIIFGHTTTVAVLVSKTTRSSVLQNFTTYYNIYNVAWRHAFKIGCYWHDTRLIMIRKMCSKVRRFKGNK